MKKLLQIPLLLVALFLTSIPISADNFSAGRIYYDILTDSTVEVTYKGIFSSSYSNEYTGAITIPSSVTYNSTTYSVTSIGASAFEGCSGLTSVTIPNSVTSIGGSAFEGCSGLTSVTIPNSVTWIGDYAFSGCTGLTSVTIPNSVTSIGRSAFYDTPWYNNQPDGLIYINNVLYKYKGTMPAGTSIEVKDGTISISGDAFSFCDGLTSVTIPNSVTSIGSSAFEGCDGLTEVTIPNSVTSIGSSAFEGCDGLTEVTIPNSVTSIGSSAFFGCSGLTSVTIPNSVTSIGGSAFSGCSGLTSVTIPNSVTSIGGSAFSGCTGLTSITIPNSVTYIDVYAFSGCSGLTSVTIPNSVTSIGYYAFYNCSGLTSVTIPNSVTSIGKYAFCGCSGLTSVTIPNSVTTIGEYAFSGCSGLTSVTIGNSVTTIGSSAFSGCTGLTSIVVASGNSVYDSRDNCNAIIEKATNTLIFGCNNTIIPNSVTSIGDYAFSGCSGLTSVTIPNSVTSIGERAFSGCSGLTSVTIPNSVTSIGKYAFNDCKRLTAVIIEDGIDTLNFWGPFGECPLDTLYLGRNINESPFSSNKLLKSVVIGDLVTTIGEYAFSGCSGLTSVTIPNSVTSIGDRAFSGCSGLTSVTIPNSVTSIGDRAFSGCTGLTSVTIPNSVTSIGDKAFYECTGLVDCNIETTHTSATIGLSSDSNCSPYIYYNGKYYKDGDIITGLLPYTNASNWYFSSRGYEYEYGLTVNNIRCEIYSNYFYTKQINLYIDGTVGVTYVNCSWSHTDDEATLVSEKITVNNSSIESEDNTIQIKNLDPNTSYTFDYTLKYKEFNSNFNISKTFTTGELNLTTQEAKPTSTTSVRLLAATNCDATEGTGFEWRRYDAPDELPSSKVSCPVVDGVLVGSLRGVKDDVYYKYRPFYTSSSGKTYYGDWIAFFTGDANVYFEPEVRTYEDIQVINNSATVKGYALEGTDVITSQGFEYWKTGSTIKPASTDDRMTVSASGISMSATLANLEYNSTYKYRAYVTTAKGTIYGDEMEFSTGEDPSGIGYIEFDSDEFVVTLRENPATGTAWVKLAGAAGEDVQYTLTSMSGAMVANGTVLLDGEWNAIDLNCSAGMYLLTINDGTQVKTLRLIVK